MAELHNYRCIECGYEVVTHPLGHYPLMKGQHYNFRCNQCKRIVSITAHDLSQMGYGVCCPRCYSDEISTWNPIDGSCPKCNGTMRQTMDIIVLAD